MNYTITPLAHFPEIYTLRDESGKVVADVQGREMAEVFAAVPEMLDMLDAIVDTSKPFSFSDGVDLQKRLKEFRK